MDPESSSSSENLEVKTMKIGIVGFGQFGQFLAKTLLKQGHSLSVTSRTDYSHLCTLLGVAFFRDMDKFVAVENDVVIMCTSIMSLEDVVKSMPFEYLNKRPPLFVDVLSVKQHPRDVLLLALPEEVDLLCTHPMFGPESGKNGWKGLSFVYDRVRIRNHDICSSFLLIFQLEGCKMVEMTCEDHDKLAAKTQFLTHTISRILAEMEIESTSIDTKCFQSLVQLVLDNFPNIRPGVLGNSLSSGSHPDGKEGTMKDSFELFSGLFVHNKFAKQELLNLEVALNRVKQQLQEQIDN